MSHLSTDRASPVERVSVDFPSRRASPEDLQDREPCEGREVDVRVGRWMSALGISRGVAPPWPQEQETGRNIENTQRRTTADSGTR